jgi:hypothetical protein
MKKIRVLINTDFFMPCILKQPRLNSAAVKEKQYGKDNQRHRGGTVI